MPPIGLKQISGSGSLHPKTLTSRIASLAPPLTTVVEEDEKDKKKSAAAHRREVYAERNRIKQVDPGLLDYADDEVDTPSPDGDDMNEVSVSRSRQHALNIIKARNSLPAEGLWRSLA